MDAHEILKRIDATDADEVIIANEDFLALLPYFASYELYHDNDTGWRLKYCTERGPICIRPKNMRFRAKLRAYL